MEILDFSMACVSQKDKKKVTSFINFDRLGEIDTMNETYKAFVTIGKIIKIYSIFNFNIIFPCVKNQLGK